MEELVFNLEQKEILLKLLKDEIDHSTYDTALKRQIYHDLSKTNKHFFTPKWSRRAWISIFSVPEFREEDNVREDWELSRIVGENPPKPKFSKRYKLYHDLETRIREPWDRNITVEIVFKD